MKIAQAVAIDKDKHNNGLIAYRISSEDNDSYFSIGQKSGLVSLRRPIQKSTDFEIIAYDHGTPPRKAILKLSVIITTQLESKSHLQEFNITANVSENCLVGSDIINISESINLNLGKL